MRDQKGLHSRWQIRLPRTIGRLSITCELASCYVATRAQSKSLRKGDSRSATPGSSIWISISLVEKLCTRDSRSRALATDSEMSPIITLVATTSTTRWSRAHNIHSKHATLSRSISNRRRAVSEVDPIDSPIIKLISRTGHVELDIARVGAAGRQIHVSL